MTTRNGKKLVQQPGIKLGIYAVPWDEANMAPIAWIETEVAIYEANDIDTVMKLWRDSKDDTKVVNMGKVG